MASYKEAKYINEADSPGFDTEYDPGDATPSSGIYRCTGCGREVAREYGTPLPAPSHHSHARRQATHWKLIVNAENEPKLPGNEPA